MANSEFATIRVRRSILDDYRKAVTAEMEPGERIPSNSQLAEHAMERMTDVENYVTRGD